MTSASLAVNNTSTVSAVALTPSSMINELATTQEQPSRKVDRCWRKVGTQENPLGGSLVTRQFKTEYRDKEKFMIARREQFPGFDPSEDECDFKAIEGDSPEAKVRGFMRSLGYDSQDHEMGKPVTAPSAEAFEANFNQIVQEHPELHLRPCKILATKGIITTKEFIEARIAGYLLILPKDDEENEEDESMHDHGAHAKPLVKNAIKYGEEFYAAFDEDRELVKKYYRRVEKAAEAAKQGMADFSEDEIKKLEYMVGTYVDSHWGNLFYSEEADFNQAPYNIVKIWNMDLYPQLWDKKFNEKVDMGKLQALWEKLLNFK